MFLELLAFVANVLGKSMMIEKEKVAVGIDLGTTYSSVCIFSKINNETKFIQFDDKLSLPSVAYYVGDKVDQEYKNAISGYLTGWDAYKMNTESSSSGRYFYGFKRVMGIANTNEISKVDKFNTNVTYNVVKEYVNGKETVSFKVLDDNKNVVVSTNAEILSTLLLMTMKKEIDKFYDIERVVVTVPAYFTPVQCQATSDAAVAAGFDQKLFSIHKEPVAAAYAYQYNKLKADKIDKSEYTLVFDLGGGTLDASIVELDDTTMIVSKHGGDLYLGGENANDLLTNYFGNKIKDLKGINILGDSNRRLKLRKFVEEFKIDLCNKVNNSDIKTGISHSDSFLYEGQKSIQLDLTIEQFDSILKPFYDRIRDVLVGPNNGMFRNVQGESKDEPFDRNLIKRIILVGGSTRLPYIISILTEIFGNSPIVYRGDNADTIVAEGACLISASESKMLSESMDVQMVDVVPVHIGICTDEDFFEPILEKDSLIPGSGTKIFTTSHDNQTRVKIRVAQGFRASFKMNHPLGELDLTIPPGQPRGVPQISVTITMSENGTIEVSAKDLQKNEPITITFDAKKAKLSPEHIKNLIKDAEANAHIDREIKLKAEAINKFQSAISSVKAEFARPDVSEDDKISVESICATAQKWLDSNKTATNTEINDKLSAFNQTVEEYRTKKTPEEAKPDEEKEAAREDL